MKIEKQYNYIMENDAFKEKNLLFDNKKIFFELSPAAAVFFASLLFMNNGGTVMAVIFAVMVHEASHLLALLLSGCHVASLKLSVDGLCIRYSENSSASDSFFPYLAGPLGGLLLYFIEKLCPAIYLPEWLRLSSRISLFLSLFNLMPAYPLDGGHAAHIILTNFLGNKLSSGLIRTFGKYYSVFLLLSGLIPVMKGRGIGITAAGIWLFCANIFSDDL